MFAAGAQTRSLNNEGLDKGEFLRELNSPEMQLKNTQLFIDRFKSDFDIDGLDRLLEKLPENTKETFVQIKSDRKLLVDFYYCATKYSKILIIEKQQQDKNNNKKIKIITAPSKIAKKIDWIIERIKCFQSCLKKSSEELAGLLRYSDFHLTNVDDIQILFSYFDTTLAPVVIDPEVCPPPTRRQKELDNLCSILYDIKPYADQIKKVWSLEILITDLYRIINFVNGKDNHVTEMAKIILEWTNNESLCDSQTLAIENMRKVVKRKFTKSQAEK